MRTMAKDLVYRKGKLSLIDNHNSNSDSELINYALNIIKKIESNPIAYDFTILKNLLRTIYSQSDSTDFIFKEVVRWVQKPKKSKPLVLLLAGTSGTGKTFTSDIIYQGLKSYGYTNLRIQMNEYSNEADSWKLFGSTQGYIGSDRTPPIFQQRERSDKIVILFDEIEKAHPTLFKNIMTLMEEGVLSNGSGETFDFKNCILLFTSNLAMDLLLNKKRELIIENVSPESFKYQEVMKKILKENRLPNEICGRIDSLLIFNSLNELDVKKIAIQEIRKLAKLDYEIKINNIDSILLNQIAKDCAGSNEGARPIRRLIQTLFENSLQNSDVDKNLIFSINSNKELVVENIQNVEDIENIIINKEELNKEELKLSDRFNSSPRLIIKTNNVVCELKELSVSIGLVLLDNGTSGEGSCFLVSSDGLVFTCDHCVPENKKISILINNNTYDDVEILYKNKSLDIAIFKIRGVENLSYLNINPSFKGLKMGDKIGLLAFPKGREMGTKVTYTEGTVSKKEGIHYYHTADATHGSSGGAFFDLETKTVYGILNGGFGEKGANINVAVDLINLYKQTDIEIEFN